jgi:nucleoside-diphosphate-sugar epimerase
MLGDGRAIVQFVHIEDVISLILSLSEQKNEGVFLCGGKDFSEMNIALRRLIDSVGSQCKIINLPKSIFEPLLMFLSFVKILSFSKWHYKAISADLYFDLDSTFQQTSWRPKFSNFEILTETYTDYIKNLNLKSNDIGLSPHLHKMNSLFIRIHLKISKVLK